MLDNISVGYEETINILEAIHIFSAATIVKCFHIAGIVPQYECKSETESKSDADIVNN
jgi:hypothetical protein